MAFINYLNDFQKAANKLDKKTLRKKQIETATGEILNSVYLKLYKKSWTNDPEHPLNAEARIFFSVWLNDAAITEGKLFYNIHAFELRHLKGHSIQSRKFAEDFRSEFKYVEQNWQNVNMQFGPLTLMEGWVPLDFLNLQSTIFELSNNFLQIDHLIDVSLSNFKK